jgi:hypothetical protein
MHFYHLKLLPAMEWKIEPLALAAHLTQWWSHTSITFEDVSDMPDALLCWEVASNLDRPQAFMRRFIKGSLKRSENAINIVGRFEMCIEFALYYRALVPKSMLVSLHELFSIEDNVIELYPHTTKQEIFAMFSTDIDPLALRILHTLYDNDGLYPHHLLVQSLQKGEHQAHHPPSTQEVDATIYDLWRRDYVSSPGTRWLPERPANIDGIFNDEAWNQMMLSLTHRGERALIAHRMLMK